ncbi:hypothetical protein NUH88_20675 [Nisaea acidiphila]|uniref:Uncharacterized protein n=1 Tax=Nisaea acidiphila TaxID=1862145 RepID=A0A9J7AQB5_9PROT|nr:hypothetical protein [Nisaea acidiphila]UUX49795.1 hypothetical protein NUH88_20675 [Nisaea acidiphila]
MSAVDNRFVERKSLEILAEAVDRTVGTGFVHEAIAKAAKSLETKAYSDADKAFRMLNPRETRKVEKTALENATIFAEHGEYSDPMSDMNPNPKFDDIRSRSVKLGS